MAALAICALGPMTVAIDASQIESVSGSEALASIDVDVAARFGIELPREGRRAIRLGGSTKAVLLGTSVVLRECPSGSMHPLPALVAPGLQALGVERLVALDDSYAFVLSTEWLTA